MTPQTPQKRRQVARKGIVERAWKGGPLQNGKTYVCDKCKREVIGVYRTKRGWVCEECK